MQINLMNDFFPPDINTVVSIIKEQTKIMSIFHDAVPGLKNQMEKHHMVFQFQLI
jgi:hypothetical protein